MRKTINRVKNISPLVSIVIATFNPIRTIEKCLSTIKKQTYKNIDIVAVDSLYYEKTKQDRCKRIIEKHARYFLDGPERSIQRNRGIKEAKGKYILLIDQDMYLTKHVVDECYKTLTKNNYVALLIPEISIGKGFWTKCVALDRYINTYLERGMNECCRFFKKSDAITIGGYDPNIVGAEDSDFHNKMLKIGNIGKIKNIIYHDEGNTDFFDRVRKKYYYSVAFREYMKRYPDIAVKQFSPFKKAYIKHWRILLRNPILSVGIFLLRSAEVMAGFLGLVFIKNGYENR